MEYESGGGIKASTLSRDCLLLILAATLNHPDIVTQKEGEEGGEGEKDKWGVGKRWRKRLRGYIGKRGSINYNPNTFGCKAFWNFSTYLKVIFLARDIKKKLGGEMV